MTEEKEFQFSNWFNNQLNEAKKKGINQSTISRDLNISKQQISNLKKPGINPRVNTFFRLKDYFKRISLIIFVTMVSLGGCVGGDYSGGDWEPVLNSNTSEIQFCYNEDGVLICL